MATVCGSASAVETSARFAARLDYSLKYFFSAMSDDTLTFYKLKFHIERALEQMAAADFSISKVSTLVGFNDPTYFNRVFFEFTGSTPM